jgi:hypothetical protein
VLTHGQPFNLVPDFQKIAGAKFWRLERWENIRSNYAEPAFRPV